MNTIMNDKNIAIDLKPQQLAKVIMSGLEGAILMDRVDGGLERLRAQKKLIRSLVT